VITLAAAHRPAIGRHGNCQIRMFRIQVRLCSHLQGPARLLARYGRSPCPHASRPRMLWLGGRFAMLPPLNGDHRPSYVVIWHIAPNWLLPGYSVQHPGLCDSNNNSLAKPGDDHCLSLLSGCEPIRQRSTKIQQSQRAPGSELETPPSPVGPREDLLGAIRVLSTPSRSPLLHASQRN
jgi:hypothetical protein